MSMHERFEELAALAAGGQVSGPDLHELAEHLSHCSSCQRAYQEFVEIHDQDLPLAAKPRTTLFGTDGRRALPEGYRDRFLARAQQAGARFSAEAAQSSAPWWRELWELRLSLSSQHLATTGVLLVICALVLVGLGWRSKNRASGIGNQAGVLRIQQVALRQLAETVRLRAELDALAKADSLKAAEITKLETARSVDKAMLLDLQQQLQEAEASRQSLETKWTKSLNQTSEEIIALQKALDKALAAGVQNDATIVALQTRFAELSEQVQIERTNAERERQLLSADRDIRDLMGARNLHIVDVVDTDASGKKTRAFGRVFYTEGKSLIFYAYDLSESKLHNAKYSFQVWGTKTDPSGLATRLGFLYKDDQAQRRWVLKVNDPVVLNHITAVFVTVETPDSKKPKGEKLLYAFLGTRPNHE